MLTELIWPKIRWILWNRRRAYVAAVILVLALGLTTRLIGGSDTRTSAAANRHAAAISDSRNAGRRAPERAVSPSASPTVSPSVSPSASPSSAVGPQAAIDAGENFAAAWVSRGPNRAALIQQIATPQLAAQLATEDNALNPATRVTGAPVVASTEHGTVDLSVPTDAGPAAISVVLTGGQWLASSVMLEHTGG